MLTILAVPPNSPPNGKVDKRLLISILKMFNQSVSLASCWAWNVRSLEPALMLTNCHFIPLNYLRGIVNSVTKRMQLPDCQNCSNNFCQNVYPSWFLKIMY